MKILPMKRDKKLRLFEVRSVQGMWIEPQVALATDLNEAIFKIQKPWRKTKGLRTLNEAKVEFR